MQDGLPSDHCERWANTSDSLNGSEKTYALVTQITSYNSLRSWITDRTSLRLITTLFFVGASLLFAANAVINVESEPVISLSQATGSAGASISFSGAGFLPTDTTCSLSSPSSNNLIMSSACVIQAGTGVPTGGFTLGNVLPGQYLIEVTGNQGDSAQAIVAVNGGSLFSLGPATGSPGTRVSIHGAGLLPTDTTCTLSSPSSPNVILPGTAACVIQAGTGVPTGGFIIGNVPPGQYVIQVTGDQGDYVQIVLAVTG